MKGGGIQRGVGLLVLAVALLAAFVAWLVVRSSDPAIWQQPEEGLLFGTWRVVYATQAPSPGTVALAVAFALLLASVVVLLEQRIATRYRRSQDHAALPLAPRPVMAETRGVYAGPVTITVLVPAHNEEANIAATLRSLQAQAPAPDQIIVVADNCTDSTVTIARRHGVDVYQTVANTHKKGGALNQVLRRVLPDLGDNDVVMVMDADTRLDDGFLAAAVRRFTDDRALMAVGGLFYGEEGHGLLGQLQRNEYIRYSRDIRRRRGRAFVLTGTASLFRSRALRVVAESRGTLLPGRPGDVYDTAALTEDNELTIALKSLGALIISPQECSVVTELMPSRRTLWNQRLRWQRGALENLGAYGFTPQTLRYWFQQFGIGYGAVALVSYFALLLVLALAQDSWVWFPFWLGVGLIFLVERLVTAWRGGWRARLVAALVIPELVYALFLDAVYVKGVFDILTGRKATWSHLQRQTAEREESP